MKKSKWIGKKSKWIGKKLKWSGLVFGTLFLLPAIVHGVVHWHKGWPTSWRTASWSSTGTIGTDFQRDDAVIAVYAARSGRLKGAVAVHSWLVVREKGSQSWDRYEVVGWGNPVRKNAYAPDANWYSNSPQIIGSVRGKLAEQAMMPLLKTIAAYPAQGRGDYVVWPGPNSNSFIGHILRQIPELDIELPPTAIGKDYLQGKRRWLNVSDGFEISAFGYAGINFKFRRGVEVNILGLVVGVDWQKPAFKLPGFGRVDLIH